MKSLTLFLILSFAAIAIFGFLTLHLGSIHKITNCLASLMTGSVCPEISNLLLVVTNFHLDAVKSFLTVTLVFALFAVFVLVFIDFESILPVPAVKRKVKFFEFFSSLASRRFRRWLAIHEISPNFFKAR